MKHLTMPMAITRLRRANGNLTELGVQAVQSWWLITGLIWGAEWLAGRTTATLPPEFQAAMSWAFLIVVAGTLAIGGMMGSVTLALRVMRILEHRRRHPVSAG